MIMMNVRIAAKSMFGLVTINENKAIDSPRKNTRMITRDRKSRKFKIHNLELKLAI